MREGLTGGERERERALAPPPTFVRLLRQRKPTNSLSLSLSHSLFVDWRIRSNEFPLLSCEAGVTNSSFGKLVSSVKLSESEASEPTPVTQNSFFQPRVSYSSANLNSARLSRSPHPRNLAFRPKKTWTQSRSKFLKEGVVAKFWSAIKLAYQKSVLEFNWVNVSDWKWEIIVEKCCIIDNTAKNFSCCSARAFLHRSYLVKKGVPPWRRRRRIRHKLFF